MQVHRLSFYDVCVLAEEYCYITRDFTLILLPLLTFVFLLNVLSTYGKLSPILVRRFNGETDKVDPRFYLLRGGGDHTLETLKSVNRDNNYDVSSHVRSKR